jgi:metal-responsive CopG/Arc/MetJ family transcriptional regulator
MRTTIQLDDDVAAAIDQVRRARDIGLSEAVNELVRAGLRQNRPTRKTFRQRSRSLGLRIDVTNVADALEELEGPAFR